ncbi:MAG: hypothetical protein KF789_06750 [Bdellovibrionaceae bacterium]|nr:hypothetical protein [Pseudobdellovibrionaceae bacterium]
MDLKAYFQNLIDRVENSEVVTNQGKDADGFYKPIRTILLRHLNLLKDLHGKPLAKPMIKASWAYVAEHLPPEWLVPETPEERTALKKIIDS